MRYFLIILLLFIVACSSIKKCVDDDKNGNMGQMFNTNNDEYSPFYYDNKLYFTSLNVNQPNIVRIYSSKLYKDSLMNPSYESSLPPYSFLNGGLPVFFKHDGKEKMIFAAMNQSGKRIHSDIFISEKINGKWTSPNLMPSSINTNAYESYPAINESGNTLLFVSDREGGSGGLDIYVSFYKDGEWTEAENIGNKINSQADETTPYIAPNFDFYFSSNRENGIGGFDIYKTNFLDNNNMEPLLLKSPINSPNDELGCTIVENYIVVSSNRAGGCGGKDLYKFILCKPIIYNGQVISNNKDIPLDGTIYLLDKDKNIISEKKISNEGNFDFRLKPNNHYFIRYFNKCFPNYFPEQEVNPICNDSSVTKISSNFIIEENATSFNFANYDIPFFVTGYYYPNTLDNLNSLRLKFNYNIFGKKDNTKYIENPGKEYDDMALNVEKALNECSEYLLEILENWTEECNNKKRTLKLKITGYADPRPISSSSIYDDETINDKSMNMKIRKGDPIDNQILSILRAYYTYFYLHNSLKKNKIYYLNLPNIKWEIEGKGAESDEEIELALQRRVNIEIGVE